LPSRGPCLGIGKRGGFPGRGGEVNGKYPLVVEAPGQHRKGKAPKKSRTKKAKTAITDRTRMGSKPHQSSRPVPDLLIQLPDLLIQSRKEPALKVFVRDNNVDQALRVLKKKHQREGHFDGEFGSGVIHCHRPETGRNRLGNWYWWLERNCVSPLARQSASLRVQLDTTVVEHRSFSLHGEQRMTHSSETRCGNCHSAITE